MHDTSDDDSQEAARWAIRLEAAGDPDPRDAAALDAWLAEKPARAGALLRAEATLAYLDRGRALADDRGDGASPTRRRILRWAAAAGGMAAAAGLVGVFLLGERGERFATAVGEIRRVPLSDGSVASLNTRSTLVVAMEDRQRTTKLIDGEAWFQVAHDRSRPFVVEAGDVRVRAVGTAFSIRRRDTGVDVLVTDGVVEAWVEGGVTAPIRLAAGVRGFVDTTAAVAATPIHMVEEPEAIDRVLAWRSGEMALDGDTLRDAVQEMNRYNRVQIVVDPALGDERLVGYFRTNDPARFSTAAAAMVGGRIIRAADIIRIEPSAR